MKTTKKALAKTITALTLSGLALINTTAANAADFVAKGKLTVGMEVSYPPFESYDGDKVVGFDPELAALLAPKMGVKPEFKDSKFTSLILGLAANKFDTVISGMYILPNRLQKADAIPYARTGAAILVLKESELQPKTEKDLCGLKVGLQKGTTWVKPLTELSVSHCEANGRAPITIQEFPSAPETAQALMSRNVQAQIEIAGAAKMFTERSRGRIQISSPELIYPQTMGIYFKKGNVELKKQLESAMAAIKADGSYFALIEKYELTPITE